MGNYLIKYNHYIPKDSIKFVEEIKGLVRVYEEIKLQDNWIIKNNKLYQVTELDISYKEFQREMTEKREATSDYM